MFAALWTPKLERLGSNIRDIDCSLSAKPRKRRGQRRTACSVSLIQAKRMAFIRAHNFPIPMGNMQLLMGFSIYFRENVIQRPVDQDLFSHGKCCTFQRKERNGRSLIPSHRRFRVTTQIVADAASIPQSNDRNPTPIANALNG